MKNSVNNKITKPTWAGFKYRGKITWDILSPMLMVQQLIVNRVLNILLKCYIIWVFLIFHLNDNLEALMKSVLNIDLSFE
jgi:hypothetical protein